MKMMQRPVTHTSVERVDELIQKVIQFKAAVEAESRAWTKVKGGKLDVTVLESLVTQLKTYRAVVAAPQYAYKGS